MDRVAEWEKIAKDTLVGRTITDAFYLNDQEISEMDWYEYGLVFVLDNGATILVQQDDEGNGPGSLYVQKGSMTIILPAV